MQGFPVLPQAAQSLASLPWQHVNGSEWSRLNPPSCWLPPTSHHHRWQIWNNCCTPIVPPFHPVKIQRFCTVFLSTCSELTNAKMLPLHWFMWGWGHNKCHFGPCCWLLWYHIQILIFVHLIKQSLPWMEPNNSLQFSQQPATEFYTNHINPFTILTPYLFKICFNITLPTVPMSFLSGCATTILSADSNLLSIKWRSYLLCTQGRPCSCTWNTGSQCSIGPTASDRPVTVPSLSTRRYLP